MSKDEISNRLPEGTLLTLPGIEGNIVGRYDQPVDFWPDDKEILVVYNVNSEDIWRCIFADKDSYQRSMILGLMRRLREAKTVEIKVFTFNNQEKIILVDQTKYDQ